MIIIDTNLFNKINLFTLKHENLINRYYLYKLRQSIHAGASRCSVIYLEDRKASIDIPRSSYPGSLEHLLTKFIAAEMYEEANICKVLLTKLTIDNLITSSQS